MRPKCGLLKTRHFVRFDFRFTLMGVNFHAACPNDYNTIADKTYLLLCSCTFPCNKIDQCKF
jgi:hypothetical protein